MQVSECHEVVISTILYGILVAWARIVKLEGRCRLHLSQLTNRLDATT